MPRLAYQTGGLITSLVVLAIFAAYSPALNGQFVFDDYRAIVTNTSVQQGNLQALWQEQGTRFIPYATFAANAAWWPTAAGYHAINIFIHVVVAGLVGYLVHRLWQRHFPQSLVRLGQWDITEAAVFGLIASLLFGLHPLTTQAVTYVVQRITSLAALAYLAAIILYVESRWRRNQKLRVAAWCVTVVAMFTKEFSFTLPFAVLLAEWLLVVPEKNSRIKRWQSASLFLLPLIIIPLTLYVQRGLPDTPISSTDAPTVAQASAAPVLTAPEYFFTQINVVRTYLRLIIFPANQNIDYEYPVRHTLLEWRTLASAAGLLTLLTVAYRTRRRAPIVAFGILLFFIALLVESSILPLEDVIFEHRTYLPLAGIIIAGLAGIRWYAPPPKIPLMLLLGIIIASLLGYATWQRNLLWQNEVLLWQDAAAKSPHKARVWHSLGDAHLRVGDTQAAEQTYEQALVRDSSYAPAYNNLGLLTIDHDLPRAEELFRQAIRFEPEFAHAYANLGVALARQGKNTEAVGAYTHAVALHPRLLPAYYNLGRLHAAAGRGDLAQEAYQHALTIDPTHLPTQEALQQLKITP